VYIREIKMPLTHEPTHFQSETKEHFIFFLITSLLEYELQAHTK
jgi:hypothetical protein